MGEPLHALPGQGQFHRPAAVAVGVVVECAVGDDGTLQSREVPVPEAGAATARMGLEADSGKGPDLGVVLGELGLLAVAPGFVGVVPDKEDLIDRAERIDLELVIRAGAGDEQLDVVVLIDRRIALGEAGLEEGLLDPVADVEEIVIPEDGGTGVVDAGTAVEILGIDSADVAIGRNVGAQLQADQAEADLRVAQARAETRRAMAVAEEQEMVARVVEMRAKVVEAEAEVPKAMSQAFREGNLGIMDYYNMRNIQADTSMRESISGAEEKGTTEAPKRDND